ncbi:uncharacterized protein LOC100142212 isoform X2 [Tribolium castaneum]|uniref:Uncharacterized protein n=1 Tax=Tribolium castaneum TaxID=7070 RepID=D2A4T7_TRICA|nr:PREDICTED: uncharacterized protein LOC100142212 isoform X2 [Tribolium castaneum]EFA05266.2 hypothetical protein TcasGA2_TC015421 [Tribolium castaneum]|eukprot:XP_001814294.1 PREDICTED: uncharacterized protein LOC100142212 isoform X2 [Tribolium castaneum]
MRLSRAGKPPGCRYTSENSPRAKKSRIGADRLTLLPGFLSQGIKSSSPEHEDCAPVKPPKLRRSWRLSKKSNQPVSVSGYFNKLVLDSDQSLFREIKSKFARKNSDLDDDFGARLVAQVGAVELPDLRDYRKRIEEEIELINGVLTGQVGRNMSLNRKRVYSEEEKENFPMKFSYVPPSSWVFQTPPNRKLNYNRAKADENTLKPAVIEKRNDGKVVYEMNKKINVDLSRFHNRQEIDIDKRYMMEVSTATFDDEQEPDDKGAFDSYELENHFLSLTSRPKKVVSSMSRCTSLKRKRDIFEPQAGCSTLTEEFKPNICFMENLNLDDPEESFTFKFTSSECYNGPTTGHLFDFDGNKKDSFNFHF